MVSKIARLRLVGNGPHQADQLPKPAPAKYSKEHPRATVLSCARSYVARGWNPIPIPRHHKSPLQKRWQEHVTSAANVHEVFGGLAQNIGVQLGNKSGGLTDVDLDCQEALTLADHFLPETGAEFGRPSKPRSHRLYVTDLADTEGKATLQFIDPIPGPNGEPVMLVELRIGPTVMQKDKPRVIGAVSMFPPSRHPRGEFVDWDQEDDPAEVDGSELKSAVSELACATLLVRYYPGQGARHAGALVLGGVLARAQWPAERIEWFVARVAETAGDPECHERGKSAKGAVALLDQGDKCPGLPRMRELWGEKVADAIAVWLHLPGAGVRNSSSTGDLRSQLDALAKLDPLDYELQRESLAKQLRIRAKVLDAEVERRRHQHILTESAPPAVDVEQLWQSCSAIAIAPDVLELFSARFSQLYAGEVNNAKLLYLTATSRLFEIQETMHSAIKGPSAVGKSALMNAALAFIPPEDVISFTSLTEKALLYVEGDFKHKILAMGEAMEDKQQVFQDTLLRQLMSEGKLRHLVPIKGPDGQIISEMIEKEGPVSFMVTTTRNKLNPENETRMLSLEVDDSAEQTALVLLKLAARDGLNRGAKKGDFQSWHDYQRWLAAGQCRVMIPFAEELAPLIPPKSVRLRRDFGQLLRAIKAHALLHREQRKRTTKGTIIATLEDYAAVRELMADLVAEASEVKIQAKVVETLEAVAEAMRFEGPGDDQRGAPVRNIAHILKLDMSAARRRLNQAVDRGYIENLESRPGRLGRYRLTTVEYDHDRTVLPSVKKLRAAVKARRQKKRSEGINHLPSFCSENTTG